MKDIADRITPAIPTTTAAASRRSTDVSTEKIVRSGTEMAIDSRIAPTNPIMQRMGSFITKPFLGCIARGDD